MRARRRTAAVAVVLLGLCATLLVAPVTATAGNGIDQQVSDAGDALDAANARVSRSLKRYQAIRAKLTTAQERSARTGSAATQALASATAAATRAGIARAELQASQANLTRLQGQLDSTNGDLADLARLMYQQGPLNEMDVILNSSSPGDLMTRITTADAISRSKQAAIARLTEARTAVAREAAHLQQLRAEAVRQEREAEQELASARSSRAQARAAEREAFQLARKSRIALADAMQYKRTVANRYRTLKRQQARIARLAAMAARRTGDTPVGALVWPIDGGTVSEGPGPRVHPVYGYRSCHTGIDIRGGTGTPIKAAADGTVVAITNGGPYGLATLLSHDGGLATFYAHQSQVKVKEGERVEAGDVIGEVGTSGWVTGPHLHFEVHVDGKPYDPRGWFGGERKPIDC